MLIRCSPSHDGQAHSYLRPPSTLIVCRKGLVMIVVYMLDALRSCLIYPIQMQLPHLNLDSQFQSMSFIMNR
ncbi:unnamed protein product [Cuscuta campestris]|uniref:Uncharacterized protein n=1 Tax=Cuscuta campestris TaxID=132261 RepID=A0A484MFM5_9ASTE|nr:unnamed protein product [Cuscuta campestris]